MSKASDAEKVKALVEILQNIRSQLGERVEYRQGDIRTLVERGERIAAADTRDKVLKELNWIPTPGCA